MFAFSAAPHVVLKARIWRGPLAIEDNGEREKWDATTAPANQSTRSFRCGHISTTAATVVSTAMAP